MSKVRNESGRTVTILRWKILPDGRVISPMGALVSELPDDVAYSSQAKHLADQNLLMIPGYTTLEGEAEVPPSVEPADVDDLTVLASIGAGRARKLNEAGIYKCSGVIDLGSASLATLLQIEESVAEAVIDDAVRKFGVGG